MGGVDVDDKPRNHYRIDIGVRNSTWWGYILFWDVGIILTNA